MFQLHYFVISGHILTNFYKYQTQIVASRVPKWFFFFQICHRSGPRYNSDKHANHVPYVSDGNATKMHTRFSYNFFLQSTWTMGNIDVIITVSNSELKQFLTAPKRKTLMERLMAHTQTNQVKLICPPPLHVVD